MYIYTNVYRTISRVSILLVAKATRPSWLMCVCVYLYACICVWYLYICLHVCTFESLINMLTHMNVCRTSSLVSILRVVKMIRPSGLKASMPPHVSTLWNSSVSVVNGCSVLQRVAACCSVCCSFNASREHVMQFICQCAVCFLVFPCVTV